MAGNDPSELRPTLQRAKATLRNALSEACRADIEQLNTGELIHIEEVLAIANEAAKEAVSVRRRLSTAQRGTEQRAAEPLAVPLAVHPATAREITDEQGTRWAVFAVNPTTSNDRPAVRERFRDGWLSFDSGAETRRLVPIPSGWQALRDEELLTLCSQAEWTRRHAGS
ncbi:MAG TPA: hypothetical protein VGM67_19865 [Gemmatimonadaceae bacterium]|jgi:hypothetical protein